MDHARTITRNLCYLGAAACLLAPVSSLAAANPNGFEVLSSKSTGVKTGQYIEAAVSAVYRHGGTAGNTGVYTKQLVPVATSTLRKGALAALGRGFGHPGLMIAITAAGFLLDSDTGEIQVPDESGGYDVNPEDYPIADGSSCYRYASGYGCYNSSVEACYSYVPYWSNYPNLEWRLDALVPYGTGQQCQWQSTDPAGGYEPNVNQTVSLITSSEAIPYEPSTGYRTAEESDLEQLDPHIPPQLYDELWNGGPIPEWQDEITVLGPPATYVQPTGDQAVAPEVASQIGKWGENVGAQLDGEPLPNPETDADGKTSSDSLYEELGLNDPVPEFPQAEPEWQVETIDALPSWSVDFTAQCPAPTVVDIPLYGQITLDWQPACDLAGWLRGVVIAVCMILALYIVLGTRASNA